MMKKLVKSNDALPIGLDIIRVMSGLIIFSFGFEIFEASNMEGYTKWLTDVGMPFPATMAYIGKVAELVGGLCLAIGLMTRLSTIPLIITMCVINFIMLEGELRSGPFYLLLLFTAFLFTGSGKISLDFFISKRTSSTVP